MHPLTLLITAGVMLCLVLLLWVGKESGCKWTPPPSSPPITAMCYVIVEPRTIVNYICPVCGNRSQYAKDDGAGPTGSVVAEIVGLRRIVERTRQACPGLRLDESSLCRHCSPGIDHPALVLLIPGTNGIVRILAITGANQVWWVCSGLAGDYDRLPDDVFSVREFRQLMLSATPVTNTPAVKPSEQAEKNPEP